MSPPEPPDLVTLARLLEAAPPVPWTRWVGHTSVHYGVVMQNEAWRFRGGAGQVADFDSDDFSPEACEANADFVVAAVNALPSLLAAAQRSQAIEWAAALVVVWDRYDRCVDCQTGTSQHAEGCSVAALRAALAAPAGEREAQK